MSAMEWRSGEIVAAAPARGADLGRPLGNRSSHKHQIGTLPYPSAQTCQAPDTPRASARDRRLKASDRLGLPTAGTGRCPFPDPQLFTLAGIQPVALQPLSRRRPLSSTGTGAVCNELHGVGRYLAAAGPCDAVTDIRAMSKTVKWRLPTSSSGASSSSRPS